MSGHTPGPWEWWQPTDDELLIRSRFQDEQGRRATAYPAAINVNGSMPYEANARLIAAAPDMLEALKRIAEWNDGSRPLGDEPWLEMVDIALPAIAKAEGRSGD